MTTRATDQLADHGTGPARPPRARWPMAALTGVIAVALIVLAILIWLLLSRSGDVAADPSPSAITSEPAAPSESEAPSEPATSPSASAGASASPAESAPAASPSPDAPVGVIPPATWDPIATFGADDDYATSTALYDMVAWEGGFMALGRQFDGPPIEGETPSRPVVWQSQSGEMWHEIEADFGEPDVRVSSIVPLPDDRVLAVGTIGFHQMPPPGEEAQRPAAWVSFDGVAWDEVELPGTSDGAGQARLLAGSPDQTYVLAAGSEVWHSDDGVSWIPVYEAATGETVSSMASGEGGFVGTVVASEGLTTSVIASADAHEWVEAEFPGGSIYGIAPLGEDWLATVATGEDRAIEIWRSANGLDWERVLEVNELTGPDGPKSGLGLASGITGARLMSADGVAYLALTWNHCCVLFESGVGVYRSQDGKSWSDLGLGEAAIVDAGAGPIGVVLAGILERGDRIGFWLEGH